MPRIDEEAPRPLGSPDHELALKLVGEYRQLWMDQLKEAGVDAVKFTQISIVSLTHIAAILAIDAGMSDVQFSSICYAQFTELNRQAPKFAN